MNVVYTSSHNTYELFVHDIGNNVFKLLMLRAGISTGNGTTLENYQSSEIAIKAAKQFPEMYKIAQEKGYTLSANEFVNPEGKRVHVSLSLDIDATPDYFASLL